MFRSGNRKVTKFISHDKFWLTFIFSEYSKVRRDAAAKTDLKGTVDYKNIIKQGGKSTEINEEEIPPLI